MDVYIYIYDISKFVVHSHLWKANKLKVGKQISRFDCKQIIIITIKKQAKVQSYKPVTFKFYPQILFI
jgi:hypothetical protein